MPAALRYLLDTNILSYVVKHTHPRLNARLAATPLEQLAISAVSVMEIRYGLALNPAVAERLAPGLNDLIDGMTTLPFDSGCADVCATLRVTLRKIGRPIGAYEALIAATAQAHDLIVVTGNESEFAQVPGVRLENWASAR